MKPIQLGLALMLLALPAQAMSKKEACETSAGIVAQAVELRQKGTGKRKAERLLTEALTEEQGAFKPVVFQTVDWIWGLKRKDATPEIAEALKEQCIAHEPAN